jgi:hypothetical protein
MNSLGNLRRERNGEKGYSKRIIKNLPNFMNNMQEAQQILTALMQ